VAVIDYYLIGRPLLALAKDLAPGKNGMNQHDDVVFSDHMRFQDIFKVGKNFPDCEIF